MLGAPIGYDEPVTTTLDPASTSAAAPQVETIDFGPLRIEFDDRVLRPRPWTAAQSRWAAELLDTAPPGRVLELCSGAGQIGLLAVHGCDRRLVCVDLNPVACAYTRRNAVAAGMGERVEVREAPLDDALSDSERFAVVVADPPWVRRPEVGRYPEDPVLAIDGGEDGLDIARLCTSVAREHLLPGGSLLLQLGTLGQVEALLDTWGDAFGARACDDLVLVEARQEERGVLARFDRR